MSDGNSPPYDAPPADPSGGYRLEHAFRYAGRAFTSHATPLVLLTLIQLLTVTGLAYVGNLVTTALIPAQTYNMTTQHLEGGGGGLFGIRSILSLLFLALVLAVGLVIQ